MKGFKIAVLLFSSFMVSNAAIIKDTSSAPSVTKYTKDVENMEGRNRKQRFLVLGDAITTGIIGGAIGTIVTPLFGPLSPFVGGAAAPLVSEVLNLFAKSHDDTIYSRSAANPGLSPYSPQVLHHPTLGQLILLAPTAPGLPPLVLQDLQYNQLRQDIVGNSFGHIDDNDFDDDDFDYDTNSVSDEAEHVRGSDESLINPESLVISQGDKPEQYKLASNDETELEAFIKRLLVKKA